MKEYSLPIDSEDIWFVLRKGILVFLIFLGFGGFVTNMWVKHLKASLDKPVYNRSLKIDLNHDDVNPSANGSNKAYLKLHNTNLSTGNVIYNKSEGDLPVQLELYNVAKNFGVTLKEERQAYSDLLQKEMEGPLKISRYDFHHQGLLRFWVNVPLYKNDSRIAGLVERLNAERTKTVVYLEQRLDVLNQKIDQFNKILLQLKEMNANGNNTELIRLIEEEIKFINILVDEVRQRLPAMRKPLEKPDFEMAFPVATPVKSFFACAIATLVCAILAGMLTGLGLLIRKRRCLEMA